MKELKQILKWGVWSLCGLIIVPILVSIAYGYGVKFCLLPYIGTAYLLILLTVVTLLIICVVGAQQRCNQEMEYDLQKKILDDKFNRELERMKSLKH